MLLSSRALADKETGSGDLEDSPTPLSSATNELATARESREPAVRLLLLLLVLLVLLTVALTMALVSLSQSTNTPLSSLASSTWGWQGSWLSANADADLTAASLSDCDSLCVYYYYFPAWHPTPENNRFHPFGTTDWDLMREVLNTEVDVRNISADDITNAQWLQQPGEMGYYNILHRDTRQRQGELAAMYGGGGFIYHIYWFEKSPLFEDFFRLLLLEGKPATPFFFDWASEDWRISGDHWWHMCSTGQDNRRAFWKWVVPFMRDPRYLRVHNRPVLSFYKWRLQPECDQLMSDLRRYAFEEREVNGFEDIYIVRVLAHFRLGDEDKLTQNPNASFDAVMEFLPNLVQDWYTREVALRAVDTPKLHPVHWRGVPANWDNRPRCSITSDFSYVTCTESAVLN